ncbi:MAG: hypothetical protein ACFFCS_25230 [Candidatus Hodarchaeota archaeon]
MMAGPSKDLTTALNKGTKFGYNRSPWKGKPGIEYEKAMIEAKEITLLRKEAEK